MGQQARRWDGKGRSPSPRGSGEREHSLSEKSQRGGSDDDDDGDSAAGGRKRKSSSCEGHPFAMVAMNQETHTAYTRSHGKRHRIKVQSNCDKCRQNTITGDIHATRDPLSPPTSQTRHEHTRQRRPLQEEKDLVLTMFVFGIWKSSSADAVPAMRPCKIWSTFARHSG